MTLSSETNQLWFPLSWKRKLLGQENKTRKESLQKEERKALPCLGFTPLSPALDS
jgi:hypothetical protein